MSDKPTDNGSREEKTTQEKRNKDAKEKNSILLMWINRNKDIIMLITQVFLVLCGLGSIWIIYYMTSEQIITYKQATQEELRAYVNLGPRGYLTYDPRAGYVGATIDLYNTGQTPAYKVCYVMQIKILPYPRSDKSIFDEFPLDLVKARKKASSTIASQGHSNANSGTIDSIKFSIDGFNEALVNPNRRIYTFGIIEYYDIFNKRRTTKFCMSFTGTIHLGSKLKMGEFHPDAIISEETGVDNESD
jgi:hypothetical protein